MANPHKNNMLINLISGQPANIAKALRFGRKYREAGWGVTLLINIEAVVLLDPAGGLGPCPLTGEDLSGQLRAFLDEGGCALAGKECLGLAGIPVASLPPGVAIATFPVTEAILTTPDLKILTW